jgi:hypothetical protein
MVIQIPIGYSHAHPSIRFTAAEFVRLDVIFNNQNDAHFHTLAPRYFRSSGGVKFGWAQKNVGGFPG